MENNQIDMNHNNDDNNDDDYDFDYIDNDNDNDEKQPAFFWTRQDRKLAIKVMKLQYYVIIIKIDNQILKMKHFINKKLYGF
jgi:hypothetical protein